MLAGPALKKSMNAVTAVGESPGMDGGSKGRSTMIGFDMVAGALSSAAYRGFYSSRTRFVGFDGNGSFDSGEEEGEDGAVADWILGGAEGEPAMMAIDDSG